MPEGDAIAKHVQRDGGYEMTMLAQWRKLLKPGDTALDIGACFGTHSVYLARELGVKVVALEPVNWKWLERNLVENGVEEMVTVHRLAAFSRSGCLQVRAEYPGNLGNTQLRPGGEAFDATPVDKLVDGPVELAKIDVEGMELEVLAGMRRLLRETVPHLFVESWERVKTTAYLKTYGYEEGRRYNKTPTYHYRKEAK
jgi:FkbM family methyltransferase